MLRVRINPVALDNPPAVDHGSSTVAAAPVLLVFMLGWSLGITERKRCTGDLLGEYVTASHHACG